MIMSVRHSLATTWAFLSFKEYVGGCQNYGPFLGTLNIRCRTIIGTQKRDPTFDNPPCKCHPWARGFVRASTCSVAGKRSKESWHLQATNCIGIVSYWVSLGIMEKKM